MATPRLAEAFPVGEFLAEEIEARGWDTSEFAGVISGDQELTPETAERIGAALGTSADLWLNLQGAYEAWANRAARTLS